MPKIMLIHGANLNFLGKRNPEHYGNFSLTELELLLSQEAEKRFYELFCYQSNYEGALIDKLQAEAQYCEGIIINPGAFSHYSYALYDALMDTQLPIVEVHLSAINEREAWRHHSVTAAACITQISGKKQQGYIEALDYLVKHLKKGHAS